MDPFHVIPTRPKLTRQITQGTGKVVWSTIIAKKSNKWCVMQQCGGKPVTAFLRAKWAGKSFEIEDAEINAPFWFYIVSPTGAQITLHVSLANLVATLKNYEIHSEDDIFLISEKVFGQTLVHTEHDKNFENEIEKLFLKSDKDNQE